MLQAVLMIRSKAGDCALADAQRVTYAPVTTGRCRNHGLSFWRADGCDVKPDMISREKGAYYGAPASLPDGLREADADQAIAEVLQLDSHGQDCGRVVAQQPAFVREDWLITYFLAHA